MTPSPHCIQQHSTLLFTTGEGVNSRPHTPPGSFPNLYYSKTVPAPTGQPTRPVVSMTMGTLTLFTNSAHPSGITTHQLFSNGVCITEGNKSYGHETNKSAQTPCNVVNTITSTYNHEKHLSTMPGLHVISALVHPNRQLNSHKAAH